MFPGIHLVKEPVNLQTRRVLVLLSDLLTRDKVPVDCELIVFYRLDLRYADPGFQAEALQIPAASWNTVVKSVAQEAANYVIGSMLSERLLTPDGRGRFRQILNALLAERVQSFGLVVDQQTGMSLQTLKPAELIWQAMREHTAAVSLGQAALARVLPVIQELSRQHPDIGLETFFEQVIDVAVGGRQAHGASVAGEPLDGEVERLGGQVGVEPLQGGAQARHQQDLAAVLAAQVGLRRRGRFRAVHFVEGIHRLPARRRGPLFPALRRLLSRG